MSGRGKLRIIAGEWRGRKLDVFDAPGLRPTPDRVRETLFNWLQQDIVGARCLDLFAGTGILGFEALSRGAKEVVSVEANAMLIGAIKKHAAMLGCKQHVIQHADALSWLKQEQGAFDLVFLDPPFNQGLVEKACTLIKEQALLNAGVIVYI